MDGKLPGARQANLDALRIVAMLMIVTLHFLGHGGVLTYAIFMSRSYVFAYFAEGVCCVAVNCYVLISGYFLVDSSFRAKKLLTLEAQVLFYSAGIYLILLLAGLVSFSPLEALRAFTPTLSGQYWFFTVYIGLYILSPFLNAAVRAMSRRMLLGCVAVSVLLFSVWTGVFWYSTGLNFGKGLGIVWFAVLYLIGAYLKLYYVPSRRTGRLALIYAAAALAVPVWYFAGALLYKTPLADLLGQETVLGIAGMTYGYNQPLVLLSSLALFLLFLNMEIKSGPLSRLVGFLSPLTFGVYLIHNHPDVDRLLWSYADPVSHLGGAGFLPYMAAVVLGVYVLCSGIDLLRSLIFKPMTASRWFNRLAAKADALIAGAFPSVK